MKRTFHTSLLSGSMIFLCALAADAQSFAPSSILAEGRWVKIDIPESGVYELSFDQLREMGFQNPDKVAVYGRGGREISVDFIDADGNDVYYDDLKPAGIMKAGDKIYFYASGPEEFSVVPGKGYVESGNLNVYSRYGHYFLSENHPQLLMSRESVTAVEGQTKTVESGIGLIGHTVDLSQGMHRTGSLFWGEDFSPAGEARREWDVYMPDLTEGTTSIRTGFYLDNTAGGNLKAGLMNGTGGLSSTFTPGSGTYFAIEKPYGESGLPYTVAHLTAGPEHDRLFIDVSNTVPDAVCALDFWGLTYPKRIPTLPGGMAQDMILFPAVSSGQACSLPLPAGASYRILQVSDPENVTEVAPTGNTAATALFTAAADVPRLVMFDPQRQQKTITGYMEVENQNLHALAEEGAELAIITTRELKEYAEQLADVHRQLQGIRTVVVTVDQLYNEFSAGVPSPMAYRAFVTMLYMCPGTQVKNVCLYGPSASDIRGVSGDFDPSRYIIAPQDPVHYYDAHPHSNYDFPGYTDAHISSVRREYATMNVGVGLLSVQNKADADIVRKKVTDFILDSNMPYRINRMVSVGGEGDRHTHGTQANQIGSYINTFNFQGEVVTNIMVDACGYQDARNKLFESLEAGPLVWNYFGHGACGVLGQNHDFFTLSRVGELKNTSLPFMSFAGCDLSMPDLNKRGLGEAIVLSTPHGAIATLMCTRSSWSGQNMELMRSFYSAWSRRKVGSNATETIDAPLTLGEIYARTKSASTLQNELSYTLIGDPAIVMPAIIRRVTTTSAATEGVAKVVPGHELTIEGTIDTHDKNMDRSFNGDLVVRLLEPAIQQQSANVVTKDTLILNVTYNDSQAAMVAAKVENGRFKTTMPVPSWVAKHAGDKMRIVISAYDADSHIGAAGDYTIGCATWQEAKLQAPAADNNAPVINSLEYLPELNLIRVDYSDDRAIATSNGPMAPASFALRVDGKMISGPATAAPVFLQEDCTRAARSYSLSGHAYGRHVAEVEVADAEGNRTMAELTFDIEPDWAALRLIPNDKAAVGKAEFKVEGMKDSEVTLYITDSDGKLIHTSRSSGPELVWDCSDTPHGIYKAFVRESGQNAGKGYSKAINVPVI